MQIKRMKIANLVPAPYHPRKELKPGDIQYEQLRDSIETFGCVQTIIYNVQTGYVIGGVQTLHVLQDLGHDETEVTVVNLDEKSEKALNIALNKITGQWDNDALSEILKELENTSEIDVNVTGFTEYEIEDILSDLTQESMISDLLTEDFITKTPTQEYFQVSFVFDRDYKNDIEAFIKENGKDPLVELIIDYIKGDQYA